MIEKTNQSFSLKRFLFGSIRKKLWWGFGVLVFLLVLSVIITYRTENRIEQDQILLKNVEAPLSLMVEKVIAYDAILTGTAHEALLHAEKGEIRKIEEHKANYDSRGFELDNLLKFEIKDLLNKSKRSDDDKNRIDEIIKELDRVNLILVDLEVEAFEAMNNGDFERARSFIVTNQYESYKKELLDLYAEWSEIEKKISENYREQILVNSRNLKIYNFIFGIIFVLAAILIPFLIINLVSKPISDLILATREIEKGNYKVRVDFKTGDEIEELGDSFNKTSEVLENLEKDRKQIDKAKTEFLSITSHELRSPMTPMKAQLQMVLGDYFGKLNKEQRESLNIVLNNTERLDKIIVDFLEISRIEAARLKFNFVRADLTKTVALVVEEMKGFMPEKKIKIEIKVEKLPVIEADPDRVSQVLRNLISNAIKFTPENGRIEVSAKLHSGMILFSVKDNGIGIDEKAQRRLFEPFYQVDNMYQHKSGGTGLGLAISKGIVESQNGKIWINSQLGKGSIFYFTVPLKPVREIKAIKLLFSDSAKTDDAIKKVFKEIIGPLGEKEFEDLKNSKGIGEKEIIEYISFLFSKGIIQKDIAEEFKNNIRIIIRGGEVKKIEKKKEKFDLKTLSRFGLIKGGENGA